MTQQTTILDVPNTQAADAPNLRPSRQAAEQAIAEFLMAEFGAVPSFQLADDGDDDCDAPRSAAYVFRVTEDGCDEDSTSYVRQNLSIQWLGTNWNGPDAEVADASDDESGFKPRRALDDAHPDGYQESDQDFVLNNLELCVAFLEGLQARTRRPAACDPYLDQTLIVATECEADDKGVATTGALITSADEGMAFASVGEGLTACIANEAARRIVASYNRCLGLTIDKLELGTPVDPEAGGR